MSTQQKAKSKVESNTPAIESATAQVVAETVKRGRKPGTSPRSEQRARAKENKPNLVAIYGMPGDGLKNQLRTEQQKGNVVILVPTDLIFDPLLKIAPLQIAPLQQAAINVADELVVIAVNNQVEVSTFALVNYAASKKKSVRFEDGLGTNDQPAIDSFTATTSVAGSETTTDEATETLTAQ